MIISHRSPWAAATLPVIFLFGGGNALAFDLEKRQAAATTPVYFETKWNQFTSPYPLEQPFKLSYTVQGTNAGAAGQAYLSMVLLWTSAADGIPTPENTFSLMSPNYTCDPGATANLCSYLPGAGGSVLLNLEYNTAEKDVQPVDGIIHNFFMCLYTGLDRSAGSLSCESYSPFFDITVIANTVPRKVKRAALTVPTAVMTVTQQKQIVLPSGASIPTASPTPTPASITTGLNSPSAATPASTSVVLPVTVSLSPSGTVTVTPHPQSTTATASGISNSSKGGLPTGAIIGIAIGGFVILVAALLVAFFCFRRRRRTPNQPEHVMLTQNMHNGSRDLIAEKHTSEGTMVSSILERHTSSQGLYDHVDSSAPYHGPARPRRPSSGTLIPFEGFLTAGGFGAGRSNLAPQRNPTSATQNTTVSNLSRGISDATRPISQQSTVRRDVSYDEPYHDTPIYGDARHLPQLYSGTLQAPFLSEHGMTDDELARLEEEERRIDAAIAEAERRER